MYIRYMGGVGLRCLSRVYHQPITKIYEALQEHQNKLEQGTVTLPSTDNNKRNRKARVRSVTSDKVQKSAKCKCTPKQN